MNKRILLHIIFLSLIGLFFLSRGITGAVIGETCCFPPDCPEENLCDYAKLEQPAEMAYNIYFGWTMISMSLFLYVFLHKRH